jgi:hypothetical protein
MTMNATDNDLLGLAEAAELLGLSTAATLRRLERAGVEPLARLRCGPIWRRRDIVEYARRRASEYIERPSVVAAAARDEILYDLAAAARLLGVRPETLSAALRADPTLPHTVEAGELVIPGSALGRWARAVAASWREER